MNAKEKQQFNKGPVTKEELQKVKEIFDVLEKDVQAYDFLEPVDYVGKFILRKLKFNFKIFFRTWIRRLPINCKESYGRGYNQSKIFS